MHQSSGSHFRGNQFIRTNGVLRGQIAGLGRRVRIEHFRLGCRHQFLLLLLRLLQLFLGLFVLLAVDCFVQGACLHVVIIEMDRLCVQERVWVHLGLLDESLGAATPPDGVLGVRRGALRAHLFVALRRQLLVAAFCEQVLVDGVVSHRDVDGRR